MNFKLKDNKAINCDIISPEISYFEFNKDLSEETKKTIINTINHGSRLLQLCNCIDQLNVKDLSDTIASIKSVLNDYKIDQRSK